jgi:hypothetical protein
VQTKYCSTQLVNKFNVQTGVDSCSFNVKKFHGKSESKKEMKGRGDERSGSREYSDLVCVKIYRSAVDDYCTMHHW